MSNKIGDYKLPQITLTQGLYDFAHELVYGENPEYDSYASLVRELIRDKKKAAAKELRKAELMEQLVLQGE